ncbi:rhodanese-related sulfurtransferase [Rhodopseudomonas rhenobacensis]|uniref:Rhodanese-related sulfurtransferase n=1 Tax=Rhodopseudomonas rhenobacensis TaxID=87461 RepID=A0A7W7Z2S5_9BRAD|nr:rhodanese-like domain-containing protein [Rhodopseudomonas rhenobacensis]MBB5046906.1 rhodanese-related sulfurtransferase [Rhodopseudomonas rhenobacensis]
MTRTATVAEVRAALIEGREIALFDVREEAPYSRGHPLFAVSLPLSRLELNVLDLAPRLDAPIVLYDDGEGLVARAAARLIALGYSDVAELDGGLEGWRRAGGEVFIDVNVPSKAFGELVEAKRHTPSLAAAEIERLIADHADIVVLDSRRFEEYRTMSIPTGTSVPGGELVLRLQDLAPRPDTTVIVNCAGRTRSIIGTQSLINAGIPNKVFALRNGTIGWTLAGLQLDHGAERRFPELSAEARATAQKRARSLAERVGVPFVDRATLESWQRDLAGVSLYLLDVRTPEEFDEGHLPGFRSAPGGQLVQATDEWIGVRHGRLVLADDDGVRATLAASWLIQMGWRDVHVLQNGLAGAELETGARPPRQPPFPAIAIAAIAPQTLAAELDQSVVIDLATSRRHAAGHVPGAWFVIRARLAEALRRLPAGQRLVLTSDDGDLARYAAADLAALTDRPIAVLAGGTAAWQAAGLPVERGITRSIEPVDDVYKRPYEGTDNASAAMQAYLDWEFGLIAQLDRDGTHGFRVL